MTLFDIKVDATINRLPKEGTVNYYGKIFDFTVAKHYLKELLIKINWKNDAAIIFFGKKKRDYQN